MTTHKIYRISQITLGIVFIASGLIPLLLSDPIARLQLLDPLPFPKNWQEPLFYGLVTMDVICGIIALLCPSRIIWVILFIVVLGYTIIITAFAPDIWHEPFGTLLKNLPILSLLWITYSLEENHHV